ncbi:hypothetical protein V1511DRAFT_495450 [Dipodascopsis uninucleata]
MDIGGSASQACGIPSMRPKLKIRIPPDSNPSGGTSNGAVQTNGTAKPGNQKQTENSTDPSTAVSSSPPSQDGSAVPPLSASALKDLPSPAVVLPPPSPSNYLNSMSMGGPGNPFARPSNGSTNTHIVSGPQSGLPQNATTGVGFAREQTPVSALPSRYVSDLLPSPSILYTPADWNAPFSARTGLLGQDLLPSPLQFHTPVVVSASQSFSRDRMPSANTGSSMVGRDDSKLTGNNGGKRYGDEFNEGHDEKRYKREEAAV